MQLIKTYGIAMAVTLWAVFVMQPDAPQAISPLEPTETLSPRATLLGFIDCLNKRYAIGLGPNGMLRRYLESDRLYPDALEEKAIQEMFATRLLPANFMDLSGIPDASKMETIWRFSSQLKEILDRLPIPPTEEIPDARMMEAMGKQSWRIPGTEIIIDRVTTGPRTGDYLFSAETVRKIPAFYAAIKDMPYRVTDTAGFYQYTFHYASGVAMFFRHIIPVRWIMSLPDWTQYLIADQPVWRWLSIVFMMMLFIAITQTSRYFATHLARRDRHRDPILELLPFITLVVITPTFSLFFTEILRVSGIVYTCFNVFFWGTFFIALTWLVWKGGQILAEAIIRSNELKAVSIDGQIIRLSFRLLSLILSLALMTEGANRLGMPAYSILTGLGIGGLAVALAAQHTLANLLGSLIIMFEKPFRVGHWIKAGTIEGVIEDVGFRSTRIRTLQNSVVSVPSSDLVNQSIENMTTRRFRVARRQIYFSLKTPIAKIETIMAEIRDIIHQGGHAEQNHEEVILKSISYKGYEVMFDFRVKAHVETEEFKEQQRILLAIAHRAEHHGIQFSRYNDWMELMSGGEVASEHPSESKAPESGPESHKLAE